MASAMSNRQLGLVLLRILLGIVFVAGAIELARIAAGRGPDGDYGIYALIFWWLTQVLLACAIVLAHRRLRWLMVTGIVLAVLTLVWTHLESYINYLIIDSGDFFFTTWTFAAALAQLGLVALLPVRSRFARWMRGAAMALAFMLATALSTFQIVNFPYDVYGEFPENIVVLLATANSIAVVGTCMLYAIERASRPALESIPRQREASIRLTCPRCGHSHEQATGKSRCPTCDLRFQIEVEEPRCECGYLLYGLVSDKCPECGRTVEQRRVAGGAAERIA